MPAAKGAGKAGKGKKSKKVSTNEPAAPTPLDSLLTRHRVAVPATLSSWKQRSDLLHLDLHLMHAPYLTLTFLLSTSSPLSCLLHRLHSVHGPFSRLRLFRCSEEEEDDELTDLSLTLDELGCRGGSALDEQRGESSAVDSSSGSSGASGGRRRYELWYSLLSSLDGALLMRESRQYISDEQMNEALQADEENSDDEDSAGRERTLPAILITADDSSTAHTSLQQQQLPSGRLPAAIGRVTPRAKMGRVVEVAVDQHTSRQRVELSKDIISEAFEVDAQAGQQQRLPQHITAAAQQQHSSRNSADVATGAKEEEQQQQPSTAVADAALSLALAYS